MEFYNVKVHRRNNLHDNNKAVIPDNSNNNNANNKDNGKSGINTTESTNNSKDTNIASACENKNIPSCSPSTMTTTQKSLEEEAAELEKINKIGRIFTPDKIQLMRYCFCQTVRCTHCHIDFQTKDAIGKWECSFHPGHIYGRHPSMTQSGTEKYSCCEQSIYGRPAGCVKCDHTDALPGGLPPETIKIPWFFFKIDARFLDIKDVAIIEMPDPSRLKTKGSVYDKDWDTMVFIVKHWEIVKK